ncbi:4Fe-4S ferredoxin [Methanoculleus sp. FWC-SCC1]|uniref:4Fe-4S ferredoxin n=1 Tax=Methanoculleus frigidifontis TaxID=2584085 RepID=A0ABT8MCX3_9EURY|nr:4Fe-4S ferredoxin [Methanoculleus sp. FWC-SCC1]MDN7025797.1 4Fe-4S ferredoxin [Methanoculleus sp. FWC-SCC1]
MQTNPDFAEILAGIRSLLADPDTNRLGPDAAEPVWESPLLGVSRGDDPLYREFQETIGLFHWTPLEAFRAGFPDLDCTASDLAVIVWALPQTAATKRDQRRCASLPARRWSLARHYGELVNDRIRDHLARALTDAGHPAVGPVRLPAWREETSERFGIASRWSERHAAYASGLGTFGLCDGLITERGKAVRIGSVVALLDTPATPRPYESRTEYCLHFTEKGCDACIRRCPAGAISAEGHDKERCFAYILETAAPIAEGEIGIPVSSCGLCQARVPCQSRRPR